MIKAYRQDSSSYFPKRAVTGKVPTRKRCPPLHLWREDGLEVSHTDADATAIFWLKMTVPTFATANQTLPLVSSIDHDVEISIKPSTPIVMLKRV